MPRIWGTLQDTLAREVFFMRGSECQFCGSGDTVKRGEGRRLSIAIVPPWRAFFMTATAYVVLARIAGGFRLSLRST